MARSRGSSPLFLLIGIATIVGLSCSSPTITGTSDGFLPRGTWGAGDGGMTVDDTAMFLNIGCSSGYVSGRIPVNRDGSFDVTGRYVLGPVFAVYPPFPARFEGVTTGTMRIVVVKVAVNDTVHHQTLESGPDTMILGNQSHIEYCP